MIDRVDQRLKDWIGSVLEATEVVLSPPGSPTTGQGVSLYLLEFRQTPPARGTRRPPLQITLRYLVTVWADRPEQAHQLLGKLVFAALDNSDFEVDPDPLPAATWQAFGLAPRPALVLRVPLRQERPEPAVPLVRVPPALRHAALGSLEGLVLGPGDAPVANAQVEVPALRRSTRTDVEGRFVFAALPSEPPVKRLRVQAKGLQAASDWAAPVGGAGPLVIRLQARET
jgi:hypothetical protein